ncbi:MAG: hypothetical protein IKN71_04930 [Alphaproteobacteria bacterium]|nr:hypothetical protein [Alphaproteobacteria bacterium]
MKKLIAGICFCLLMPSLAQAKKETVDTHLINEMLTTLNQQYIRPVDNADLIYAGVQVMHDMDKKLVISKGTDKFYVYYDGMIRRPIPFPYRNDDILGWVKALSKIIATSAKYSDAAHLHDFELPDLIMKRMTDQLDEYTHYYSEYEYNEEERKNAVYTLFNDRIIDDDILYLKVRTFNQQTSSMIKHSLEKYGDKIEGVILDLRSNSGGILNEAIQVASMFCDNEIITYTSGRNPKDKHYYTSGKNPIFTKPMVVMIDAETASAAEVLAGALQEQSRAKLIGTHSFGKGTIQSVTKMSNDGKLVLTTEQFFTPSGKIIHKKGIDPDVCLTRRYEDVCNPESRVKIDADIDAAFTLLHEAIPVPEY